MDDTKSLCHSKWECKHHIVWIPKSQRKVLYGRIRKYLVELLHGLREQDTGRPLTARSYTYAGINTTGILRSAGNWVYQG